MKLVHCRESVEGAEVLSLADGSGVQEPLVRGSSGIRVSVETAAALMIQATQGGDVQLLADILAMMFGNCSNDRAVRVDAAVSRYMAAITSTT